MRNYADIRRVFLPVNSLGFSLNKGSNMNKMILTCKVKWHSCYIQKKKNENSITTQHTNNEFDAISTDIKPITMPF